MQLTSFISDLINTGKITVPGMMHDFTREDDNNCIKLLQEYYAADRLEMPGNAPAFSADAALWAAKYFYLAVQLTVIRDADETVVQNKLQSYRILQTPSAIYSVDLIFRYLPALLLLAKGLSPSDPLVKELQKTVAVCFLCAPGIEFEEVISVDQLSDDPSLWQLFIDRIIQYKDSSIIQNKKISHSVAASLGNYTKILWPEFESILNRTDEQHATI